MSASVCLGVFSLVRSPYTHTRARARLLYPAGKRHTGLEQKKASDLKIIVVVERW